MSNQAKQEVAQYGTASTTVNMGASIPIDVSHAFMTYQFRVEQLRARGALGICMDAWKDRVLAVHAEVL